MNDNEQQKNNDQALRPVSDEHEADDAHRPLESPRPRPQPSYGEITEGESGATLWQTIKMALRE